MDRVLDPHQFAGRWDSADAPTIEGGQSTYEGAIAVTLLDRAVVSQALPNGFALAARANPGDGVTTHPVVHMIGFQGSPMLIQEGEVTPAPDPGYTELIVLIPFVVKQGRSAWHSFVVRMYLNDPAAIFIGNTYYSYRKAFAAFDETDAGTAKDTLVRPFLEGDVFRSAVGRDGPWLSCCGGAPDIPAFADIRTLLTMPLLGAFVDGAGNPFQTVCSYWEWDFRCAEVAPATSEHVYMAKIERGTEGWIGPATAPAGGAMLVRGLRWRIPLPPEQCLF